MVDEKELQRLRERISFTPELIAFLKHKINTAVYLHLIDKEPPTDRLSYLSGYFRGQKDLIILLDQLYAQQRKKQ